MPFRKIEEETGWEGKQVFCRDPEHLPPMHIVLEPGTWEYECPSCHKITRIVVPRVECSVSKDGSALSGRAEGKQTL